MTIDAEVLSYLTPQERVELDSLLLSDTAIWRPLPGPQTEAYESQADIIGYGGAAGGGKGLALNTPIPTPGGWTTMGAVSVGDVLFDDRGEPCKVVAVSEINNRQCYRIVFDDHSAIVSDDVHRWITFDAKELAALTRRDPEWRAARRKKRQSASMGSNSVRAAFMAAHNRDLGFAARLPIPTGTMRDTQLIHDTLLTGSGRRNHAVRVAAPLRCNPAPLPVPPYTLGAWLGDGSSRNGQITGIDNGILDRIESDGFEVRHYAWDEKAHSIIGLKVLLRDVGVLENKHIPQSYLRSSYEQRIALLQGLMDTDGHAALDGGCEFDGVNETLVRGVFELVHSLGIKATIQTGTAKLNGREIGKKWRVKFVTNLPVFGLQRKQERLRPCRRTSQFRYIVSCDRIQSVPTRCIAVNSPSRMYLAGSAMIPTHNTDLACGKSLTRHRKVGIFRTNGTELTAIIDRFTELVGSRDGFNGKDNIWRYKRPDGSRSQVEFGSFPNAGDEKKYQGRPHDLLVFDEAANMRESQVRFLLGWLRTTVKGQKCQALLTFNPPTTVEGRWIIDFFGPWLDRKHPHPAQPGELRWFATVDGKDVEVACGDAFDHNGEMIKPMSRTFIPSRISDNPYLMGTGYMATLQSLPEPLRSQMLYGDFSAGVKDDPWQVCPTAWVEAAMARWEAKSAPGKMLSLGADIAQGGGDNTVIACRYEGMWFDELRVHPGKDCPDGPTNAGHIISACRDGAPQHIDLFGVGSKPYGHLMALHQDVIGVDMGAECFEMSEDGTMGMFNIRTKLIWRVREALDPNNKTGIALPNDKELLQELCAYTWEPVVRRGRTCIKAHGRDAIIEKIGHSPDRATAIMLANMDTPRTELYSTYRTNRPKDYDPLDLI